jgi:Resolvase, N terminal domain
MPGSTVDAQRTALPFVGPDRALETFRAQGIEFVSFSEQLDTSTPAGKMVFTVLGAVAELERGLIVERVKAACEMPRPRASSWEARRRSWIWSGLLRCGPRAWLEADRRRDRRWGRNDLSCRPRRFQNPGKGYLNSRIV